MNNTKTEMSTEIIVERQYGGGNLKDLLVILAVEKLKHQLSDKEKNAEKKSYN